VVAFEHYGDTEQRKQIEPENGRRSGSFL